MSDPKTCFKKVDYDLSGLLHYIDIGDIGLHVIKWMCNYETFHQGEQPGKDIMRWMADLYAESDRRFADDPDFQAQVRAYFGRWDAGDAQIHACLLYTSPSPRDS